MAPGQFIEIFPNSWPRKPNVDTKEYNGYTHFSLLVENIEETKKMFEKNGVPIDSQISKGPSETYQMWSHDPDGNLLEVMEFTNKSWQVVGHGLDLD